MLPEEIKLASGKKNLAMRWKLLRLEFEHGSVYGYIGKYLDRRQHEFKSLRGTCLFIVKDMSKKFLGYYTTNGFDDEFDRQM